MNQITFPLKLHIKRPEVGDLLDALQLWLERSTSFANNEDARKELSERLTRERTEQTYGSATRKLVNIFQEEQRLESSGEVDEPTAKALNKLLHEWGMLDWETKPSRVGCIPCTANNVGYGNNIKYG